jgi:hypothetical protein
MMGTRSKEICLQFDLNNSGGGCALDDPYEGELFVHFLCHTALSTVTQSLNLLVC